MNNNDITLNINFLKQNIINNMRESNLPISVIYLVLKDLYQEVEKENYNYTNEIIKNYNEQIQKEKEKKEKENMISADEE